MLQRLSRKKKVVNPFEEITAGVAARQEVIDIQEIGGDSVSRGRLKLFIDCMSTAEKDAFRLACKTFGEGTVKRFIMDVRINSNVIDTLLKEPAVDDLVLLTLDTLKAQFAIYVNNLDVA